LHQRISSLKMDSQDTHGGEETRISTTEAVRVVTKEDDFSPKTAPSSNETQTDTNKTTDNPADALSDLVLATIIPKLADTVSKPSHDECQKYHINTCVSAKSVAQTKWEQMLKHLLDFKEKHGHCLVPNRYPDNPQLGSWVSTQRRQYKTLQASLDTPMTHERARILEDIGFVWQTRDPRHVPWSKRYEELCDYNKKYGNCLVPIGYKDNVQLSNWVSTQRQEYKLMKDGKPSRLTPERIQLLNAVDFIWEAQRGGPRRKRSRREIAQDVWDNLVPASEANDETVSSDPSFPPAVSSSDVYQTHQEANINPDIVTSELALPQKFQRRESTVDSYLAHHQPISQIEDSSNFVPYHVASTNQLLHPAKYTARIVTDDQIIANEMHENRGDAYDNYPRSVHGRAGPQPLRVDSAESSESSIMCSNITETTAVDNDIFADADEDDEHNAIDTFIKAKKRDDATIAKRDDATIALLTLRTM